MPDQTEIAVQCGNKKVLVVVDSNATRDEMLNTIVDTINNDPDCLVHVYAENGAICQSPVEELVLRCLPDIDSPELFYEKKGRRRGQRCRDFPRR